MENSKETVAWVGLARADPEISVFFLPHGAPARETERKEFAKDLMRALVRFSREHSRIGEGRGSDSPTQANLLADIATDFRDNGLYSTREKIAGKQDGKPDWAKTVKSGFAFPVANGAPIYLEISTSRYTSFATSTVARIQAIVLNEIAANHGWWLGHYFGSREIPDGRLQLEWPRETWPKLLRLALRELFQYRAVRLVRLLLDYLELSTETGQGNIFCGISDFSTMWEVMLRETLDGVEPEWNALLPRSIYTNVDGNLHDAGRMQLDIVVRVGNRIFILDAKYYRASSKGYVPSMPDVSKQIIYQMAAESTGLVERSQVSNAFLFPAMHTCREPYRDVQLRLPDGSIAAGFPHVDCQYVSIGEVVAAYAGRRKLQDQAWLHALGKVN